MAFPDLDDLPEPVRDLLDITVGLGLLTFQRAQVQRRAFEKQIEKIEPELPDPARSVARNVRVVSETVGEGLARLLVPGPSRPTPARHEPIRPEADPDHPQEPDHSQAAGHPQGSDLSSDTAVGESPLDNHLGGRSTGRLGDDHQTNSDETHGGQADHESSTPPDETRED